MNETDAVMTLWWCATMEAFGNVVFFLRTHCKPFYYSRNVFLKCSTDEDIHKAISWRFNHNTKCFQEISDAYKLLRKLAFCNLRNLYLSILCSSKPDLRMPELQQINSLCSVFVVIYDILFVLPVWADLMVLSMINLRLFIYLYLFICQELKLWLLTDLRLTKAFMAWDCQSVNMLALFAWSKPFCLAIENGVFVWLHQILLPIIRLDIVTHQFFTHFFLSSCSPWFPLYYSISLLY